MHICINIHLLRSSITIVFCPPSRLLVGASHTPSQACQCLSASISRALMTQLSSPLCLNRFFNFLSARMSKFQSPLSPFILHLLVSVPISIAHLFPHCIRILSPPLASPRHRHSHSLRHSSHLFGRLINWMSYGVLGVQTFTISRMIDYS